MSRRAEVPLISASLAIALFVASEPATRAGVETPCLGSVDPLVSMLAVGDTGKPPRATRLFDTQYVVGQAMAREHQLRPVDALLFLGDNFYPDGLTRGELVERLRDNLVSPYCRFLALAGPRSTEIAGTCLPPIGRPPVQLLAVLGNHDYHNPESPQLQREVVPDFISNWSVPAGLAQTYELEGGLSLTLFDSQRLQHEDVDPAPLVEALRRARGPWRLVAAHHPVGARIERGDPRGEGSLRYNERVRAALEEAGVRVHAFLAGHEHNLQAIKGRPPLPPLLVVSGAGSRRRETRAEFSGTQFELVSPGFVRVDLVSDHGGGQRLMVSYFATARYLPAAWAGARVVACWSVSTAGSVREEHLRSYEHPRSWRDAGA